MRRMIRVLVGFAAVLGGALVASPLLVAEAQVGDYGPVEWFPVEGESTLWCTTEAQTGCADRYHHDYFAMDIGVNTSTEIVAAGRGQVTFAVTDQPENCPRLDFDYCNRIGRSGNRVVVTHADGVTSYYGHMSRVLVSKGDWVDETTVIGFGGDAGPASGEHLHFEVRDRSGEAITFGSLRACDGRRSVTYPEAFGVATWSDAPTLNSRFTHSGASRCSTSSGRPVISIGAGILSVTGETDQDSTSVGITPIDDTGQGSDAGEPVDQGETSTPTGVRSESLDAGTTVKLSPTGSGAVIVGSSVNGTTGEPAEQAPTTQPPPPPPSASRAVTILLAG